MIDRTTQNYVIYLLHFETEVSGKRHYCGIARAERLDARLTEHASARGANLTRRAALSGVTMYLAATTATNDPRSERRMKKNGHLSRRCPLCQTPPWDDLKPIRILHPKIRTDAPAVDPVAPAPTSGVLSWDTADHTASSSTVSKSAK